MHDADFGHEHAALSEEDRAAIAKFIWSQDNVELRTIGIDIGSSTSHLLFAKVLMQRQSQGLSSRFLVVDREIVWRSPIMLTPFLPDGTIDAGALGRFIHESYAAAGIGRSDVDSGAVILTGEAIKRTNARAIDEVFAEEAGKFVCATAGHKLECTLAAHGSGAVALSRKRQECVLHVDIGGGTTKLALIDKGTILGVAAFAVGGRLIAQDADGRWTRVDDSARMVAEELGLKTDPANLADIDTSAAPSRQGSPISPSIRSSARRSISSAPNCSSPSRCKPRNVAPVRITFSGGVSEYIFAHEESRSSATSPSSSRASSPSSSAVAPGCR